MGPRSLVQALDQSMGERPGSRQYIGHHQPLRGQAVHAHAAAEGQQAHPDVRGQQLDHLRCAQQPALAILAVWGRSGVAGPRGQAEQMQSAPD